MIARAEHGPECDCMSTAQSQATEYHTKKYIASYTHIHNTGSGVAKLGHTGARALPIGGCALPLEVCPNVKQLTRYQCSARGAEFSIKLTAGRHQRIRATR